MSKAFAPEFLMERLVAALGAWWTLALSWDPVTGYLTKIESKDRDGNVLFTFNFAWDAVTGYLQTITKG